MQVAGQANRSALGLGVRLGVGDAVLQRAHRYVGRRHVGVERHQHVAPVLERGLVGGRRRLDGAPDAAEDVDLPAGVEADRVEAPGVEAAGELRQGLERSDVALLAVGVEGFEVDVGELLARGHAEAGAGLEDPRRGLAQVEVRGSGPLDEVAQHRVVELLPPGLERRLAGGEALDGGGVPGVGGGGDRRYVVRADDAGGAEQGEQDDGEASHDAASAAGLDGTRKMME